ncbi:PAC2 family protein [Leekyejoonella antrihumi]|uniref:PAC2 family protein n=1 Tax=Leekyejoonella antrihumi TaxID=1660198 RepID=A0A563DYB4_9MICO|nr:PAC2 family protein [Leekyejoonella antrihumi]TWP35206.1 PAC2 family protein [Leekyejoonella antrihumi]
MRDPQELYQFETDTHASELGAATMVVSLGGLIDAGHTQRLLTQHLLGALEHSVVASFNIDELLDYRSRRPLMTFDRDHFSHYDDPTMLLYRMQDAEGTPFYLLAGPEPDFQWERVIEAVRSLVRRLGVQLVVSATGIPMGVPHTRPVGMTQYASDTRLIPLNSAVFGMVQVPSSLETLLHMRLGESGIDTVGFAVHVPHYLTQTEFGDAAVAALGAVCGVTGLSIPAEDLVAMANHGRAEIEKQVADSGEATEVVHGLEQQYDAFQEGLRRQNLLKTELAALPSADEIGAEFEQFLRKGDDDEPGDDPKGPREA